MIAPQWQIALAVLCGFAIGALCTYLACRMTSQATGDRRRATEEEETVGADADGQASGAPQGRPQQSAGARRSDEQHDHEVRWWP